jgi:AcrR family transcriptional regulator
VYFMEKRPYLRTDDRRRQLLDAAARLFAREGYAGLTMVALATEAGVSRRLVYDHFPDLASLHAAFFDDRAERYLAAIAEAVEAADDDSAFPAAFAHLLAMPADDQRAIRVLVADPGLADLDPVRERFREHVEQQWLGRLPEGEHARAVLWTLVTGLFGLAELVSRDEVSHDAALTIATNLVTSLPAAMRNSDARPASETPPTETQPH